MTAHYYAVDVGNVSVRDVSKLTIGTSASAKHIEVRIDDLTMTRRQASIWLRYLSELFASNDGVMLPSGNFKG